MTVHHKDGGHFATPHILKKTGRSNIYATFDLEILDFDIEKTTKSFHDNDCKVFYIDISYTISPINIQLLREHLGPDAIIIYDASHTIGLMMGHEFQSPLVEGADILCANTHKTLPGPQKALIATKNPTYTKNIQEVLTKGLVSSSHTHHLIALAITILEMSEYGESYARQIVKNSNTLGDSLEKLGLEVRKTNNGDYSQNHQVHLYIDNLGDRKTLYARLVENKISTNFDNRLGDRLFIRIGTQEITRRGMSSEQMKSIAKILKYTMEGKSTKEEVEKIVKNHNTIEYSFDNLI